MRICAFLLYLLLLAVPFDSNVYGSRTRLSAVKEAEVYICKSGGAYAYQVMYKCSGLQHCKHTIERITISEAISTYKRKPCKNCSI